jgi:hypothetical protein
MSSDRYVWLTWSSAFLLPWVGFFVGFPRYRRVMVWASAFTMPFGLTEPVFVPRYWEPPSLFDLAHRTGFDIESLIFSFAIGGVGAVLYNIVTGQNLRPVGIRERRTHRHHFHGLALVAPVLAFPLLSLTGWNPIYPAMLAMALGGAAAVACRPDLKWKTWLGGLLFAAYYTVFMALLEWSAPGYIARVWNLTALSGFMVAGIPLEELLFGFAFGAYWSGVYEHLTWHGSPIDRPSQSPPAEDLDGAGPGTSAPLNPFWLLPDRGAYRLEPIDHALEKRLDPICDAGKIRVLDGRHRGDRIDRRDFAAATACFLDDHVARQHRADLVFGRKRFIREPGIAGAEDAVFPEVDAQLLLERVAHVDLGDDPEPRPFEGFPRPLKRIGVGKINLFGEIVSHIALQFVVIVKAFPIG